MSNSDSKDWTYKHIFFHVIMSFILSLISLYFTGSYLVAILTLLAGVFIDADHLVDYLIYLRRLNGKKRFLSRIFSNFSISDFLTGIHFRVGKKSYIPLHSYELVLFLVLLGSVNPIFLWVGLSMALHILFDQFTYPLNKWTYFLLYRRYVNYELSKLHKS